MSDDKPQPSQNYHPPYAESEVDRIVFLIKAALAVSLGLYAITFWEVIAYTISLANMRDFFISITFTVSLLSLLATLNHVSKAFKIPPENTSDDAPQE